jgi:4-amino-4-deoxy-L-arabinose transferase-like glycosyltransferase
VAGWLADWRVRLALVVAPIALVGLFSRVYYTPDEPREASLALAMASQSQHAIPELGGRYFMEKPPLQYWLSGAAIHAFGASPAAARLPLLLSLSLAMASLALLAARAAGSRAGFATGLVAASALQLYQVEIWLATDSLLLAGVALALLGLYLGYTAPHPRRRLIGYALFHAGLLVAFFAKNLAGWVVPALAFATLIVWDGRYGELLRRELWLPVPVLLALVLAWVFSVGSLPGGRAALRVFFVDNLLGRAIPLAADAPYAYTKAHQNSPGKYLLELPAYLLPWTPLAVAALRGAKEAVLGAAHVRIVYRLALGAFLPAFALLSLAATARGIYLAPALLGLALLLGLWSAARERHDRFDRLCLALTALLAALEALAVAVAAALACYAPAWRTRASELLGLLALLGGGAAVATALGALYLSLRRPREGLPVGAVLGALGVSLALTLGPTAAALYSRLNDFLDLRQSAARLEGAIGARPLLLLYPDETTEAMVRLYLPRVELRASLPPGQRPEAAGAAIAAAPDAAVLYLVPGRQWGLSAWRAFLGLGGVAAPAAKLALPAGLPPLALERLVSRPGGRSYALLSLERAAPEPLPGTTL